MNLKVSPLIELLNNNLKTKKTSKEDFLSEFLKNIQDKKLLKEIINKLNLSQEEKTKLLNKFSIKTDSIKIKKESIKKEEKEIKEPLTLNIEHFIIKEVDIKTIKAEIIKKSLNNPILKKIISTKEFKSASTMKDIINLSKKFDLNLIKIAISTEKEKINKKPSIKTIEVLNLKTPTNQPKNEILTTSLNKILTSKKGIPSQKKTSPLEQSLKIENLIETKHKSIKDSINDINFKKNEKNHKKEDISSLKENISKKAHNNINTLSKPTLNTHSKEISIIQLLNHQHTTKNNTLNKKLSFEEILTNSKEDSINHLKKDSSRIQKKTSIENENFLFQPNIEIKHKIIQTSLKHFQTSIQKAIENYKPPVTKLSLELHPKELGKVEVTLKQRGDELHIQINTNNQNTLNFFSINQQELKNSLINMGFTNINMNFNSNDNQKKEQHHQNKQNKKEKNEEEPIIEFNYKYA